MKKKMNKYIHYAQKRQSFFCVATKYLQRFPMLILKNYAIILLVAKSHHTHVIKEQP